MRPIRAVALAPVALVGSIWVTVSDLRAEAAFGERQSAQLRGCSEDLPFEFVEGVYSLLGKRPGGETYAGALRLKTKPDCTILMVRCIGGLRREGVARFDHATADKIPVLKTHFQHAGRQLEGRFKIDGDFDNRAVLTGPYRVVGDASSRWGWEYAYVDPNDRPSCD